MELQLDIKKRLPYSSQWALAKTSKHFMNNLEIRQPGSFFLGVNKQAPIFKRLRGKKKPDILGRRQILMLADLGENVGPRWRGAKKRLDKLENFMKTLQGKDQVGMKSNTVLPPVADKNHQPCYGCSRFRERKHFDKKETRRARFEHQRRCLECKARDGKYVGGTIIKTNGLMTGPGGVLGRTVLICKDCKTVVDGHDDLTIAERCPPCEQSRAKDKARSEESFRQQRAEWEANREEVLEWIREQASLNNGSFTPEGNSLDYWEFQCWRRGRRGTTRRRG